jgi:hypothetical protein
LPKADNLDAIKWLQQTIDSRIDQKFRQMGIPNLYIPGVVKVISQIPASSGKYFADVYLNGSTIAATNIPVNPDIAANVAVSTPVWVLRVNFDQADLYVAMRKLA